TWNGYAEVGTGAVGAPLVFDRETTAALDPHGPQKAAGVESCREHDRVNLMEAAVYGFEAVTSHLRDGFGNQPYVGLKKRVEPAVIFRQSLRKCGITRDAFL